MEDKMKYHKNDEVMVYRVVHNALDEYFAVVGKQFGPITTVRTWVGNRARQKVVLTAALRHTVRNPIKRWMYREKLTVWGCSCFGPCLHIAPDYPDRASGWLGVRQRFITFLMRSGILEEDESDITSIWSDLREWWYKWKNRKTILRVGDRVKVVGGGEYYCDPDLIGAEGTIESIAVPESFMGVYASVLFLGSGMKVIHEGCLKKIS